MEREYTPNNKIIIYWLFAYVLPASFFGVIIYLGFLNLVQFTSSAISNKALASSIESYLKLSVLIWLSLIIILFIYSVLIRTKYNFKFEDNHLSIKKGFFFFKEENIPYSQINQISLSQNFIEKLLKINKILIQTPGRAGTLRAQVSLKQTAQSIHPAYRYKQFRPAALLFGITNGEEIISYLESKINL
jgi:uncharacterized membrane protein YdbT with pleckstrin-like domain